MKITYIQGTKKVRYAFLKDGDVFLMGENKTPHMKIFGGQVNLRNGDKSIGKENRECTLLDVELVVRGEL